MSGQGRHPEKQQLLSPGVTPRFGQELQRSRVRSGRVSTPPPSLRPLSAPGNNEYLPTQPLAEQPLAEGNAGTDKGTGEQSRGARRYGPCRPLSAPLQLQQALAIPYNQMPAALLQEGPAQVVAGSARTFYATPQLDVGTQLAAQFMREAACLHSNTDSTGRPLVTSPLAITCTPCGHTRPLFVAAPAAGVGADAEPPAVLTAGFSTRGQMLHDGASLGTMHQVSGHLQHTPASMDMQLPRVQSHLGTPHVPHLNWAYPILRSSLMGGGAQSVPCILHSQQGLFIVQGKRERGSFPERPPAGPKRSAVGSAPARAASTEPDDDEDSDGGSSRADRGQSAGGPTAAAGYTEEREAKKQLRKEKNRASAAASRARREAYTASLEEEVCGFGFR